MKYSYDIKRYMGKDMLQANGSLVFPIALGPENQGTNIHQTQGNGVALRVTVDVHVVR